MGLHAAYSGFTATQKKCSFLYQIQVLLHRRVGWRHRWPGIQKNQYRFQVALFHSVCSKFKCRGSTRICWLLLHAVQAADAAASEAAAVAAASATYAFAAGTASDFTAKS